VLNPHDGQVVRRLSPSRVYYNPHFIEADDSGMCRRRPSAFRILFAGRLDTEQKGADVMLDTIAVLSGSPQFKNMDFTIVGSGELASRIAKFCEPYDNVRYEGYVDSKRLQELYLSHDVCVIPSRWETFSYVCLESQCYGLFVIASNTPGPRDIVVQGRTGFLVQPEDAKEFGLAILKAYNLKRSAPERFEELQQEIRRNTLLKYSRGRIIPELERMFQETGVKRVVEKTS
jgi:glycosyltransferase involved in cell wall biosynthesis